MTEEEKYCETCNHIEMCKWTPISGCAFHSKYEQRPHGEWDDNGRCTFCGCSRPHECIIADSNGNVIKYHANFCPNCGADMREGDSDA